MIQTELDKTQSPDVVPVTPPQSLSVRQDKTGKLFFIFFLLVNLFLLIISGAAIADYHYKICTYVQHGFGTYNSTCPNWFTWYGASGEAIVLVMFGFAMTLYILPIVFYSALINGAHAKLKVAQNLQESRFAKIIIYLLYLLPVLFIFCVMLLEQNINDRYR